jgi:hypothetical protein
MMLEPQKLFGRGTVGWVLPIPNLRVDKPREFDRDRSAFVMQFCICFKPRHKETRPLAQSVKLASALKAACIR